MPTLIEPVNRTRTRRLRNAATMRRLLRRYDNLVECPKAQDAEVGPQRIMLLAAVAAHVSTALYLESNGQFGSPDTDIHAALHAQRVLR